MAAKAKRSPRKKTGPKRFQVQLGWGGMLGIAVVFFCLFLWMFLLGIWAGQTILFPAPGVKQITSIGQSKQSASRPVEEIQPQAKKKAVNSDQAKAP